MDEARSRTFRPALPHLVPRLKAYLAEILDRAGTLRAANATNGESFERGRIYVAPPGTHLLLHDALMLLQRGPRESLRPAGYRPSVQVGVKCRTGPSGGGTQPANNEIANLPESTQIATVFLDRD